MSEELLNNEAETTEELRANLTNLRNKQKELEGKINPPTEPGQLKVTTSQTKAQMVLWEEELSRVNDEILVIENKLQERKTFKKQKFIDNFKALVAKTGVKIGQIETEAMVAPGYLSRIDKPDSTTDPSIEFIATAARLLDVSIDFLLTGKVEELSQTEAFLVDFFDSIIEDTAKDEIVWKVDEKPDDEYFSETGYPQSVGHPLYWSRGNEKSMFTVYYNSQFEDGVHVVAGICSYVGTLPNTSDRLYIMACAKDNSDPEKDKSDTFVECYLETGNEVSPLCSSHRTCETVSKKITELYKEIGKSAKRIHISHDAVAAINKYMRSRIPEELPFS